MKTIEMRLVLRAINRYSILKEQERNRVGQGCESIGDVTLHTPSFVPLFARLEVCILRGQFGNFLREKDFEICASNLKRWTIRPFDYAYRKTLK